jgi:hypothetical protein
MRQPQTEQVAIEMTYGDSPIRTDEKPFVINMSALTSKAVSPVIIGLPSAEASSQLEKFGPKGLFREIEPGWHAEEAPAYPQKLNVDLHEAGTISSVEFLPQDDYPLRAPKAIEIKTSNDNKSWTTAARSDDICATGGRDGWRGVTLGQTVTARYLEIEILANCGDPDLLTLRGLRIAGIRASSQFQQYGPEGLFAQSEPGWHAERNPAFPQTIDVDFHVPQVMHNIEFLPQDGSALRAPKVVRIKVSNDGKSWTAAANSDDVCGAKGADGWHDMNFDQAVTARFLEVEILANCGDPDFLTLRGLRIN